MSETFGEGALICILACRWNGFKDGLMSQVKLLAVLSEREIEQSEQITQYRIHISCDAIKLSSCDCAY